MKKLMMIGLVLGSVMVAKADATFDVVLPAVPAVEAKAVQLKAVVTDVSCRYLPPSYSNAMYVVRFNVVKPDGSTLRTDMIRITQEQVAASGDPAIPAAMAGLGVKVNEMLVAYISRVSTNATWLSGGR